MATIYFNNKNFEIPEAALSAASGTLHNHLSTIMSGTGATINFGGVPYNIDSAKLSIATNAFVSHLGTIAGGNAGGDTLTIEQINPETIDPSALVGGMFLKVSDSIVRIDDFTNGLIINIAGEVFEAPLESVEEWAVQVADGVTMIADVFISVEEQAVGVDVDGFSFSESGLYAMVELLGQGETSITIPGYTGFGDGSGSKVTINSVEYFIDPTKIADAMTDLESALSGLNTGGSDTLTWDGNTSGKVNMAELYFKVSNAVITYNDLANGYTFINAGESITLTQNDASKLDGMIMLEGGIMSIEESLVGKPLPFAEDIIISESGTYFMWSDDAELHITSLTIPGYTGF